MNKVNLISLKCANCSAALEISDRLNRFICNYCGTEQLLQHDTDGYFFKRLEDRLESLEKAAEKGNIELALKRMREDLQLKMVQYEAVGEEKKKSRDAAIAKQNSIYRNLFLLAICQAFILYIDVRFSMYFIFQIAIMVDLSRQMHLAGEGKINRKDLEKKFDNDLEVIKNEINMLELKIRKRKRQVDDDIQPPIN